MENTTQGVESSAQKATQTAKKAIPKKPVTFAKKVDMETAKLISQLKEKINKKQHGRCITDAEIIGKAIPLLNAQHIQELQESTFSQQDKLLLAYESYSKEHGKVSYEEFLGILLKDLPTRSKKS